MGLCKTPNFSIFTFVNASDFAHILAAAVYCLMRFKGSNGKVCKMMLSHPTTLHLNIIWIVPLRVSIVKGLSEGKTPSNVLGFIWSNKMH